MIQRIQTIYLLLVLILGILCFFIPFANFYIGENFVASMNVNGVVFSQNATIIASLNMILLAITTSLTGLLALFAIFIYKKRKIQALLVKIDMFLIAVALGEMYLFAEMIKTAINAQKQYYFAAAFPLLSLLFLYLALKAINKDEDLVKAADRLR